MTLNGFSKNNFHEFKHGLKVYPQETAFLPEISFDDKYNTHICA